MHKNLHRSIKKVAMFSSNATLSYIYIRKEYSNVYNTNLLI